MTASELRHLPTGRLFAVDDQGTGLRATWHLDQGIVNLSVWKAERCVETFHLSIEDAGRLTGFLAEGLSEAARSVAPPVAVAPEPAVRGVGKTLRDLVDSLRRPVRR